MFTSTQCKSWHGVEERVRILPVTWQAPGIAPASRPIGCFGWLDDNYTSLISSQDLILCCLASIWSSNKVKVSNVSLITLKWKQLSGAGWDPNVVRKGCRGTSFRPHPRVSGPAEVVQGADIVTAPPILLGLVLVWSQQNLLEIDVDRGVFPDHGLLSPRASPR